MIPGDVVLWVSEDVARALLAVVVALTVPLHKTWRWLCRASRGTRSVLSVLAGLAAALLTYPARALFSLSVWLSKK